MLEITEATFERDVLEATEPVLVEFWSTWCASCKQQERIMEELEADYGGKVRFGKVKMEENQNLAIQHTIMSAPTLLLFAGGQMKRRFSGLQRRAALEQAIEGLLT